MLSLDELRPSRHPKPFSFLSVMNFPHIFEVKVLSAKFCDRALSSPNFQALSRYLRDVPPSSEFLAVIFSHTFPGGHTQRLNSLDERLLPHTMEIWV